MKTRKQTAEQRGRQAERIAAIWLRLKGYRILARNVVTYQGEIDIIASRQKVLIFVEVKYRSSLYPGQQAVSHGNWCRISRAAEIWTGRQPRFRPYDWRYDLILVCPGKPPRHFPDYWRP